MQIKVIGLGGIGNCLVHPLARFLQYHDQDVAVTLIDGDVFEQGNAQRQYFARFGNKAEVTAEWLAGLFPSLLFRVEPRYAALDNLPSLVYNGDIVLLGVDNHASRKLVSDHGENLSDVVVISGGNELKDGCVQIFIRRDGENITLPLANDFHPEIQNPADNHPLANGCMQMLPGAPQVIFANNTAATVMLNSFYALLQGQVMPDEIYFDLLTGSCRPVYRSNKL